MSNETNQNIANRNRGNGEVKQCEGERMEGRKEGTKEERKVERKKEDEEIEKM